MIADQLAQALFVTRIAARQHDATRCNDVIDDGCGAVADDIIRCRMLRR